MIKKGSTMEDVSIIELFFRRSERAIEEIRLKYEKLCAAIIRRIVPDSRDVEECVSDTWLRVWNSIPPDRPDSLKAYVARISRNLALDRYDYNSAEKRSTALTEAFEELEPCLPEADGYDQVERAGEFRIFINGFLRSLNEETRVIFVLRYWYGYNLAEIAKELSVSEPKIKSSLFRTRNRLLDAMTKEGMAI